MNDRIPIETYSEIDTLRGVAGGFICRQPTVAVSLDRDATLARLEPGFFVALEEMGLDPQHMATADQVHGGDIAIVDSPGKCSEVDGLITKTPGLALGIVVADCCAVFLVDPVRKVIGLVHSGKKGTEAEISVVAIRQMEAQFGSRAEDLVVRLSPCIRPPAYEVDIAASIRAQVEAAGVPAGSVHDDGICTTSDLEKYYSYRAEKGATGRMMAVLALS